MNIQDEKDRIDEDIRIKKLAIDKQGEEDRQEVADLEADRIKKEAEEKAQQIQNNAQN